MKRIAALSLIICLLFSFCGCALASQVNIADVSPDDRNVLHLALEEDIGSPDVQVSGCTEIAENIFSRLVRLERNSDGSSSVKGDLAESWDISADGREYTFHLRSSVRFTNGEEFEADDVLFTIDRMLDPDNEALQNDAAEYIYGAYDVMLGERESVENSGVFIIDKYTVKLVLKEAWAPFISAICDTSWSIYNRDARTAGAYSVGTGPYIFDDWKAGEYVFLTVNNDYFNGKAAIDGILYRIIPEFEKQLELFTAGELDIIKVRDEETADLYLNDPECSKYIVADKEPEIWYYAMNQNIVPFTENGVRKGLQRIIDRKSILSTVFKGKGQVLNGLIPYGMQGYEQTTSRIKYNAVEAQELFSQAGFNEGFSITICQTGSDPVEEMINTLVCEQLNACNITAAVKKTDPEVYYSQLTGGTLPMHLCHLVCSGNDPSFIFNAFTPFENARFSINCQSSDLLKRCADALTISDTSARMAEYKTLEEIIVNEDVTVIPLFQVYSYVLVNPRVEDYIPGSNSVFGLSIEQ